MAVPAQPSSAAPSSRCPALIVVVACLIAGAIVLPARNQPTSVIPPPSAFDDAAATAPPAVVVRRGESRAAAAAQAKVPLALYDAVARDAAEFTYVELVADACGAELPRFGLTDTELGTFKSAIVEVGTNVAPESKKLQSHQQSLDPVERDPPRLVVTVDPLPNATNSTLHMAFAHRVVEGAIGPECGTLRYFEDGPLSGFLGNSESAKNGTGSWIAVPVLPLSAVLAPLRRLGIPVQQLIVDAQGFDLSVVMSAGASVLRRGVATIVLECQDLEAGHPQLHAPNVDNCRNASRVLTSPEYGFTFGFCMHNMGFREMNCAYINHRHPLVRGAVAAFEARRARALAHYNRTKEHRTHKALLLAKAQRVGGVDSAAGAADPFAARLLPALPLVGDLWMAMCPSLTIAQLFLAGCMLSTLIWEDPGAATVASIASSSSNTTLFTPAQCHVLRAINDVMPEQQRRRTGNKAVLTACDTRRPLVDVINELKRKKKKRKTVMCDPKRGLMPAGC